MRIMILNQSEWVLMDVLYLIESASPDFKYVCFFDNFNNLEFGSLGLSGLKVCQ